MPRLELFPFRYRDRLAGKWVRARYVATPEEIAARYAEFGITGPPETREVDPAARLFTPHTKRVPHRDDPPAERAAVNETPDADPALDDLERFPLLISPPVRHPLHEIPQVRGDERGGSVVSIHCPHVRLSCR